MNRRFIFKHYWWIALVVFAVGLMLMFIFDLTDIIKLVGSLAVPVVGFCYFVQQQKLAETALFKELFTEFNRRYDEMNDELVEITDSQPAPKKDKKRQKIVDYFNLCAEEYLFFREGYIYAEVWRSWCKGMLWYLKREPFESVWAEEAETDSYYGLTTDEIKKGAA